MILLTAIIFGLLAGWVWASAHHTTYRAPNLVSVWLVLAAFVPQLVIAYLPATQRMLPDPLASLVLPLSLAVFLAFVWLNRRLPGMPILMAGLILNLLVIVANGGWMPISPVTAGQLPGGSSIQADDLGRRFGQKDVLLLPEETHLALLADRFLLPAWIPYKAAFSPGDVLVAIGAFWLLARPWTDARTSME